MTAVFASCDDGVSDRQNPPGEINVSITDKKQLIDRHIRFILYSCGARNVSYTYAFIGPGILRQCSDSRVPQSNTEFHFVKLRSSLTCEPSLSRGHGAHSAAVPQLSPQAVCTGHILPAPHVTYYLSVPTLFLPAHAPTPHLIDSYVHIYTCWHPYEG